MSSLPLPAAVLRLKRAADWTLYIQAGTEKYIPSGVGTPGTKENIGKEGFKLIERPSMEMIELMEDGADVRVYFSNPPLDKQLGLV